MTGRVVRARGKVGDRAGTLTPGNATPGRSGKVEALSSQRKNQEVRSLRRDRGGSQVHPRRGKSVR